MQETQESAGLIPGWERSPGGGHGNPLQYYLPGESHGQKSLEGCSPWGHKEPDTTEVTWHAISYDHGQRSLAGCSP